MVYKRGALPAGEKKKAEKLLCVFLVWKGPFLPIGLIFSTFFTYKMDVSLVNIESLLTLSEYIELLKKITTVSSCLFFHVFYAFVKYSYRILFLLQVIVFILQEKMFMPSPLLLARIVR